MQIWKKHIKLLLLLTGVLGTSVFCSACGTKNEQISSIIDASNDYAENAIPAKVDDPQITNVNNSSVSNPLPAKITIFFLLDGSCIALNVSDENLIAKLCRAFSPDNIVLPSYKERGVRGIARYFVDFNNAFAVGIYEKFAESEKKPYGYIGEKVIIKTSNTSESEFLVLEGSKSVGYNFSEEAYNLVLSIVEDINTNKEP